MDIIIVDSDVWDNDLGPKVGTGSIIEDISVQRSPDNDAVDVVVRPDPQVYRIPNRILRNLAIDGQLSDTFKAALSQANADLPS